MEEGSHSHRHVVAGCCAAVATQRWSHRPPQTSILSVTLLPCDADSIFHHQPTTSRFIVNLPQEELDSIERICFQIEQAHWFYEDFIRPQASHLPSYSLRKFSELVFKTNPLLS